MESATKVTVTFNTNGGSNISAKKASIGKTIAKPANTTKEGFFFVGWYKDEKRTIPFKFNTEKITQNITLYADWILNHTISAGAMHALYIKDDGTLWTWGWNKRGQLGLGDNTHRSSPTQVGSDTWRMVSAGAYHSLGIKTDGTLWTWGRNKYGQLGIGKAGSKYGSSKPRQVGSDTWRMVSAGPRYTLGIKEDGTLWAWGRNKYGSLGLGDKTDRSNHTQVGSDTWRMVSAGTYHSLGIKTDGTLWTWGWNERGQLGLGDKTDRSSPTQVGSDTWRIADAGFDFTTGIKTDGTLQLFGSNAFNINSPSNIEGKWLMVIAADSYILGIKEDNTLWAWGFNFRGELGLGDNTHRSNFMQIGSDTWRMMSAKFDGFSFGIKTDGTLWAWGRNKYGQLGIGNTTNQNAPVQVIFSPPAP